MYRVSTARFMKMKTCPSAEVLLLYGGAGLTREREQRVAGHLAACDFCGAEMELLSKHWRRDIPAPACAREMPSHLRRLAEDLMSQLSLERARLVEAGCELDRLTLTDAA